MTERKGNRLDHNGKRLPSRSAILAKVEEYHQNLRELQVLWKHHPYVGELDIQIKGEQE